ncbi:MAG: ATP-binding cassette domain-containing protein, partial [Candidatus Bathyarchaeia archaeon]
MPVSLACQNVTKSFGKFTVISKLSFNVEEGKIFGLVGPNGSGKTTLYNLITKVLPIDSGEIRFKDQRIDKMKPHKICRLGIARTFQIPAFFGTMPVWEQVMVGSVFGNPKSGHAGKNIQSSLEFVGLHDKSNAPARMLNTFDKKKLMIATALST